MNKTLTEGLKPYALGEKLRGLRLKKSMGLVQLGKHSGLSPAMLSKLERGKLFPTLPTLLRIAMVFSVGLDYFFTDERKRYVVAIVRKQDRIRFPERPGGERFPTTLRVWILPPTSADSTHSSRIFSQSPPISKSCTSTREWNSSI
jgi:transcriptional regulator with XRE-family HTH domain